MAKQATLYCICKDCSHLGRQGQIKLNSDGMVVDMPPNHEVILGIGALLELAKWSLNQGVR